MTKSELACVYASLILYDDNIEITPERITTICKAANIAIEPFWPTVIAKVLKGRDISGMLSNVGTASAAAPVTVASTTSGGGDKAKPEDDKKEEETDKKEAKAESSGDESGDDMGFGLFGDDSD